LEALKEEDPRRWIIYSEFVTDKTTYNEWTYLRKINRQQIGRWVVSGLRSAGLSPSNLNFSKAEIRI
jgi:hypothetical protein